MANTLDVSQNTAPRGRRLIRPARWTTRSWLGAVAGTALAALLLLSALAFWATARSAQLSDSLVDDTTPELVAAVQLEAALVNQETGIRGYGLTGQQPFLQPYTDGLPQQHAAAATLQQLSTDDPVAARDLKRVLDAARTWQSEVAQPVAATSGADAVAVSQRLVDDGKADFDALRAQLASQQQHLKAAQANEVSQLRRASAQRNGILVGVGVIALLLIAAIVEGLRRAVTDPLRRLSAHAQQVAGGEFDQPIVPHGPADLRALAAGVESMRRRLVDELAAANQARAALDQQADELRRSNAELEQFAYVASHDLQEPLRKVASFCQLLQRRYAENLDERANQYIGFAVDGAMRMQALINDLLAFSRVGRVHVEHTPIDLDEVTRDALGSLSLAIEDAGAEVTHDPLPVVAGDRTQLEMLMQNLLGNAVKFRAPDRPARIHVEAVRDGERWRLAVRDNGIGIAPQYEGKVFAIFQRLHTRQAYPGNGIGLALCKKIVEFHGGTIAIDHEYASGARITFDLPAVETLAEDPAAGS